MTFIPINAKIGDQFLGKKKRATFERLWTFSGGPFAGVGWPKLNTHTDSNFARERGLRKAIASGTQFEGYVIQLMIDLFGVDWLSQGTLDMKFVGHVEVDDVVFAQATVTEINVSSGLHKFFFDVSVENQHGKKVLAGKATGIKKQ